MLISNINKTYKVGKYGSWDFNCWGATLFILEKNKYLRWEMQKNILDFLEIEAYIIPENKLQKGDIIALFNDQEGLIHTAIYIRDNKYFHKRGSNESEFVTKEEILNYYNDYTEIQFYRPLKRG